MKLNRTNLKLLEIGTYLLAGVAADLFWLASQENHLDRAWLVGLWGVFAAPYVVLLVLTGPFYFSKSVRIAYLTYSVSVFVLAGTIVAYGRAIYVMKCLPACWPFVFVPFSLFFGASIFLGVGLIALWIVKPKLVLR